MRNEKLTVKEILRQRLRDYLECEKRILVNQSYTIGQRVFTMTDLYQVRRAIADLIDSGVTLEDDDTSLNRGRQKRVVFIDN